MWSRCYLIPGCARVEVANLSRGCSVECVSIGPEMGRGRRRTTKGKRFFHFDILFLIQRQRKDVWNALRVGRTMLMTTEEFIRAINQITGLCHWMGE